MIQKLRSFVYRNFIHTGEDSALAGLGHSDCDCVKCRPPRYDRPLPCDRLPCSCDERRKGCEHLQNEARKCNG